jgi:hypothetical protein
MKSKILMIIFLILVILLGVFVFSNINFKDRNMKVCTLDAKLCPDGSSVSRDPDNNCEFYECPGENEKHFCTSESRNVDACITLYQPVCGFFNPEKIQCIIYPCAVTYGNGCVACQDENVLYWEDGECSI